MKHKFQHDTGLMVKVGENIASIIIPDVYDRELDLNSDLKRIIEGYLDADIEESEFPYDLVHDEWAEFQVHYNFDGDNAAESICVEVVWITYHNFNTQPD